MEGFLQGVRPEIKDWESVNLAGTQGSRQFMRPGSMDPGWFSKIRDPWIRDFQQLGRIDNPGEAG
jgi:hypothetical protein